MKVMARGRASGQPVRRSVFRQLLLRVGATGWKAKAVLAALAAIEWICGLAFVRQASSMSGDTRPAVIIISVDTLRADHLGIYGYRHNATPNIDSFADHGTLFTHIDSQIPLTLPSHTSLFTSTYPFQNHVTENAEIVPANVVTLASALHQNGYQTGAFVGSALLARRYGLSQGFDVYDSPFGGQREERISPYNVSVRRDGALVTRAALRWLETKRGRPVFAFVHLFDLHTPYAVRQYSGSRLIPNVAGYDAEVSYVDELAGHFKEALVRSGWWQRSVVILLSDHGESLGDHGETGHGYFVYESTLHVPLIMHWPEGAGSYPAHVEEPAGLIDVAPTLLGFLHIPVPRSFVGVNLLDPAHAPPHPVWSESTYAHDAFHWAVLRRLRVLNLVYIDAPRAELYDLGSDPAERHDVLASHMRQAHSLKDQLTALQSRYSNRLPNATADSSQQSTATLRSLGYLSGTKAGASGTSGPDPKDRLGEYQAYEKALTALYGNEVGTAAPRFLQILSKDPDNTLARYYLGETYARLGHYDDAIRQWRTAVSRDHTYEPALVAIGELLLVEKQPDKAREAFAEAVAVSPSDGEALYKLSTTERELGMREQAQTHLEEACRLEPSGLDGCEAMH